MGGGALNPETRVGELTGPGDDAEDSGEGDAEDAGDGVAGDEEFNLFEATFRSNWSSRFGLSAHVLFPNPRLMIAC